MFENLSAIGIPAVLDGVGRGEFPNLLRFISDFPTVRRNALYNDKLRDIIGAVYAKRSVIFAAFNFKTGPGPIMRRHVPELLSLRYYLWQYVV